MNIFKERAIELKLFLNKEELDANLTIENIPFKQPLTEIQFAECKLHWHLSNLPNSAMKTIHKHDQKELEEIESVANLLINMSKTENIESVLYDPNNKTILEAAEIDDGTNPIGHSIMKLIARYSDKLSFINSNKISSYENDAENVSRFQKLLGIKHRKTHHDEYLDNLNENSYLLLDKNQYYCENMFVFTTNEPCFMCSMALVHSRIARIYFIGENDIDGGLGSVLKINNYNLNHNYLVFKLY